MNRNNYKIREWIFELPQKGKITFSMDELYSQFPTHNKNTVSSAIRRLVEKRKIQSVWHNFYVVVPVEYELKGIVPPIVYIDQLMKYLHRNYYIGLLNAAIFYGAAHQQPQEFTVITDKKNFRDKFKNGVKINFVSKKVIPNAMIKKITTKTGYISVSNPVLTAVDLIVHQKEIGGLSRSGTVLNELAEEICFDQVSLDFFKHFPITAIQRLGYILDIVLGYSDMASILLKKIEQVDLKFRYTPLKPNLHQSDVNYSRNETWKIIINENIEIDE